MEPTHSAQENTTEAEVVIDLEEKAQLGITTVGVNPGNRVSWKSIHDLDTGDVKVIFGGNIPFVDPPRVRDNEVSKDVKAGQYPYQIIKDGVDIGGGDLKIPCEPPGGGTPRN
jgi:hypothetical protein